MTKPLLNWKARPASHLIVSWLVGQHLPERRDRLLVAYAGVAPDLDGLSLLAGVDAYGQWHHVLTHGIMGAALVAASSARLAKDRLRVCLMALTAFHLHLLCDFFGSGHGWGLTYWYPFSTREYISSIQWDLNAWPNVLATALALGMSGWLAVRHGRSVAETVFPARWDAVIVETLKNRFGNTHQLHPEKTGGIRELLSSYCVENCAGIRSNKLVLIERTAKDRNG